jgi:hypothetical protein
LLSSAHIITGPGQEIFNRQDVRGEPQSYYTAGLALR